MRRRIVHLTCRVRLRHRRDCSPIAVSSFIVYATSYHNMRSDQASPTASGETERMTLSTGETITLPLSVEATMLGAVFAVPRRQLAALLPDGLRPMRVTAAEKRR